MIIMMMMMSSPLHSERVAFPPRRCGPVEGWAQMGDCPRRRRRMSTGDASRRRQRAGFDVNARVEYDGSIMRRRLTDRTYRAGFAPRRRRPPAHKRISFLRTAAEIRLNRLLPLFGRRLANILAERRQKSSPSWGPAQLGSTVGAARQSVPAEGALAAASWRL